MDRLRRRGLQRRLRHVVRNHRCDRCAEEQVGGAVDIGDAGDCPDGSVPVRGLRAGRDAGAVLQSSVEIGPAGDQRRCRRMDRCERLRACGLARAYGGQRGEREKDGARQRRPRLARFSHFCPVSMCDAIVWSCRDPQTWLDACRSCPASERIETSGIVACHARSGSSDPGVPKLRRIFVFRFCQSN